MRKVLLKSKKGQRSLKGRREFYEREVEEGLKSCQPGEWVILESKGSEVRLLAMANPQSQKSAPLRVLECLNPASTAPEPELYIKEKIQKALKRRNLLKELKDGSRLIFGESDELPGLIVDEYLHCLVVQINTAGLDRFRDLIQEELGSLTKKNVYFLDNEAYREAEGLPHYEKESLPDLEIKENELRYFISRDVVQKVGYYYDHRLNRLKLSHWIKGLDRKFEKGVDLFSYCGSWGLNALSSGVEHMVFVDQGDFEETLERNLQMNNFEKRGEFFRSDVFQWLQKSDEKFDLVISDPPAFSKSLKNKSKALGGYQKLHRSLSTIVKPGSLLAIGSCTHGVSLEELDQTVFQGFQESSLKLQLLDLGIQGPDHPISHLHESHNYIKFLLYLVY